MPEPAPTMTVLGRVMWRTIDHRLYAVIPTAMPFSRTALNDLAITDEETNALDGQSRNVLIRIFPNEDIHLLAAKFIRLPHYFRALIIASRGLTLHPCDNECANRNTARFKGCMFIPGFEGSACAECVLHANGHRCEHNTANQSAISSSDGTSYEDEDTDA